MRTARTRIRTLDYLIFAGVLLLIGLISFRTYVRGSSVPEISIDAAGTQWIYPLDAQETVSVPGPLGDTIVSIHDGSVQVLSSPCPEKICVKSGRISRPGQWIACLPNRVFISIRGRPKEQPDAISQ